MTFPATRLQTLDAPCARGVVPAGGDSSRFNNNRANNNANRWWADA